MFGHLVKDIRRWLRVAGRNMIGSRATSRAGPASPSNGFERFMTEFGARAAGCEDTPKKNRSVPGQRRPLHRWF